MSYGHSGVKKSRSTKKKPSKHSTTGYRRASDPEVSHAMALMLNNADPTQDSHFITRVPLPLPYSPSDYIPSPSSPKHFVVDRPYIRGFLRSPDETPARLPGMTRHRSQSAGEHDARPAPTSYLAIEDTTSSGRSFELVPYREWTVISRNDVSGQIVLYNAENKMVTVQQASPGSFHRRLSANGSPPLPMQTDECPLCHRPFTSPSTTDNINEPTFMDRNYFRLLASLPSSTPAEETPKESETETEHDSPLPPTRGESSRPAPSTAATMHLKAEAFNQGYYRRFFVEKKKLGRGFRGSVYLCEHELDGVKLGVYAVKKVAIGNNHPWLVKMLREVHLLERLRHPNIVSYKHSWLENDRLTPFGPEVPCLFILMECANGGNLEEYLEPEVSSEANPQAKEEPKTAKQRKRERIKRQLQEQEDYERETQAQLPIHTQKRLLSLPEIWSLFLDIVEGLGHLHEQNIVHRDLKPPNLLLKWENHPRGRYGAPHVLISDFGECEDLEETMDSDRTGATGTLEFMAPEHVMLNPEGRNKSEYSAKADMWSLGMVLYYLCYSRLPYEHIDDVDILREEILAFREVKFPKSRFDIYNGREKELDPSILESMQRQKISSDIPQELKILIRMLLSLDPNKRPSCAEILSKIRHMQPALDNYNPMSPKWFSKGSPRSSSPFVLYNGNGPSRGSLQSPMRDNDTPSAESNFAATSSKLKPIGDFSDTVDTEMSKSDDAMDTNSDTDRSSESNDSRTSSKRRKGEGSSKDAKTKNEVRKRRKRASKTAAGEEQEKPLVASPESVNVTSEKMDTAEEEVPLLLAPHPAATSRERRWWYTTADPQLLKALKTVTAVLKIGTCMYPCYPYAPSPAILYPVTIMAVLDFWSERTSHSLFLVGLHVGWVVMLALIQGSVCVA
ncbi:kinase-like domain-containing protein [Radiomyces spectabilis]|uniref:kinase-like domain-containing protein n=1 Tax=Radiomyces spectabilis TaxID=64574 RepID=UPI00221EE319|nr:kinase-like domain-containing protein [Radiomyces spectabilis]KAI8388672.1 kinase-like domain-containing protein [Radiomyces spectabilis]